MGNILPLCENRDTDFCLYTVFFGIEFVDDVVLLSEGAEKLKAVISRMRLTP